MMKMKKNKKKRKRRKCGRGNTFPEEECCGGIAVEAFLQGLAAASCLFPSIGRNNSFPLDVAPERVLPEIICQKTLHKKKSTIIQENFFFSRQRK
jgi:hypothetical protein